MNRKQIIAKINELIENGYAETHAGYHADYRIWNGVEQRGCYAQVAAPYGGTKRIYADNYSELLIRVYEEVEAEEAHKAQA